MQEEMTGMRLRSLPFLVVELDTGVVLKRGQTEILLEGESALEIILLILTTTAESSSTPAEICDCFPAPDREQIMSLIAEMVSKRLLVPADSELPAEATPETTEDVFYWSASTTRVDVVRALSDLRIVIAGVNRLSHKIWESLHAMGVDHLAVIDDPALRNLDYYTEEGKFDARASGFSPKFIRDLDSQKGHAGSCVIATSDFGGRSFLLPWNAECVSRKSYFMPVCLKDMIGYTGPLVVPGQTACLQCLFLRQNAHLHSRELIGQIEDQMDRGQSIAAVHPSMITILAETTVFELCHFFGALPHQRPGRLISVNLAGGTTTSKQVLKVPRCPVCSPLLSTSAIQIRKLTPLPK